MERIEIPEILKYKHGQSAPPYDALTMGKMRVDTLNAAEGTLTGYDCPKCRNRGFMAVLRDDGSYFVRDCDCMPMRRCIRQMERSGLSKTIREMTFDAFKAELPWQKALKNGAMEYARDPKDWLMYGGQPGSGKSHLCTAVCREILLRGHSLQYMPWRGYLAKLKALSFDCTDRSELLEKCKNAPYLYIDDLFKTGRNQDEEARPTQADINLAFEILNHRYCQRLPTIISSEKTPQELVDIDEAIGSRIIEMCGKHVYCITPGAGKNYRLRNVVCL